VFVVCGVGAPDEQHLDGQHLDGQEWVFDSNVGAFLLQESGLVSAQMVDPTQAQDPNTQCHPQ
jgi:hypothetical protein